MVHPTEIWEKAARAKWKPEDEEDYSDGWDIWYQAKNDERLICFSRLMAQHRVLKEKLSVSAGTILLVLAPPVTGYFLAIKTKVAAPIIAKSSKSLMGCFVLGSLVPFILASHATATSIHGRMLTRDPPQTSILKEQFANNIEYGMGLPLVGLPLIVISVATRDKLQASSGSRIKDLISAYSLTTKPLIRRYAIQLLAINAVVAYSGVKLKLWGIDRIISAIGDDPTHSRTVMNTPTWAENFQRKYLSYGIPNS